MAVRDSMGYDREIAVVGMAARVPGAAEPGQMWRNLKDGVESIRFFDDDELRAAGCPEHALQSAHYVKAKGVLEGAELFDAALFGVTPRDAAVTDPQHRVFLECAWEALEAACCDPERFPGAIGVYAGRSASTYLLDMIRHGRAADDILADTQTMLGNERDYLATWVSFKLGLRGPSINLATSCSSSLVAVHYAVRDLLQGECDIAVAGGVSIGVPQLSGYWWQEGGANSADGHCRPFDAAASGTVTGNGCGIVVLRRLGDALASGDHLHAVILGSAVNNDGDRKVGFTAPGGEGQAAVIARALKVAGVAPDTVGYVEAHGTATLLGDPIEVAALSRVYGRSGDRRQPLFIGSIKSNIGHLDAAAGAVSLIKTVLALEHQTIPPTLHFRSANPELDLQGAALRVADALQPWPGPEPRRAGVSAFGFGGTNAHLVLEEAPERPAGEARGKPWKLLLLSAGTPAALQRLSDRLTGWLEERGSGAALDDVAYSLQIGRRQLPYRRRIVCRDIDGAVAALRADSDRTAASAHCTRRGRPVVFVFPGQGSEYPSMARTLYDSERGFRRQFDECCEILRPSLECDLREVVHADPGTDGAAAARLEATSLAQPALFATCYGLARLWLSWGIEPSGLIGHSLGEYVAATLAGVWTLEDALAIVAQRAAIMNAAPRGRMLAVPLAEQEIIAYLDDEVSLAAVNGPSLCVVSGPEQAVQRLGESLDAQRIASQPVRLRHAFHSPLMQDAAAEVAAFIAQRPRAAPALPYVSSVTGAWIGPEQATDPDYYARQMLAPVQFWRGISMLAETGGPAFLELGPPAALSGRSLKQALAAADAVTVQTLPASRERADAALRTQAALGDLWLAGVSIEWNAIHRRSNRSRLPLPTYPFEPRPHWYAAALPKGGAARLNADAAARCYVPSWTRLGPPAAPTAVPERLLVIGDAAAADAVAAQAAARGIQVARGRDDASAATVLCVSPEPEELAGYARTLGARGGGRLVMITSGVFEVTGTEALCPEAACAMGPVLAASMEYAQLRTLQIDVDPDAKPQQWCDVALAELCAGSDGTVAVRGPFRWQRSFEQLPLDATEPDGSLRPHGVYLISGGFGGVGLAWARHLARRVQAKLVLFGRSDRMYVDEVRHALQEIEAAGGEALTLQADVTDMAQVRAVVAAALERFGRINGVFHAAGIAGGRTLAQLSAEDLRSVLAPKVRGVQLLDAACGDQPLDLFVVFSSLRSVVGAAGQAAYAAANAYLDTFALARRRRAPGRTLTINWGGWAGIGMGARSSRPGLTAQQGVEALERALALDCGQAAILAGDIAEALAPPPDQADPAAGEPAGSAHVEAKDAGAAEAPPDSVQQTLLQVWREAFGIPAIGVNDNFFDLGGDSLLALRLSALAQRQGLRIAAEDLFDRQTIAELAPLATGPGAGAEDVHATADTASDSFPAAPMQRWVLEQQPDELDSWSITLLLEAPGGLSTQALSEAARAVVEQHEALRIRLAGGGPEWQFQVATSAGGDLVTHVDASWWPAQETARYIQHAADARNRLDLRRGRLLQVVHFDRGDAPHRLLIVAHHMATDARSLRILVEDLHAAYLQAKAGDGVWIGNPSAPFSAWAAAENRRAQVVPLPSAKVRRQNTAASARTLRLELAEAETDALVRGIARQLRVQVRDILLGALCRAGTLAEQGEALRVDLESDGRTIATPGPDFSRTVGWMTRLEPLSLCPPAEAGALDGVREVAAQAKHPLARFERLAPVAFAYLGEYGRFVSAGSEWRPVDLPDRDAATAQGWRSHRYQVAARIRHHRLCIDWTFSEVLDNKDKVEAALRDYASQLRAMAS